MILTQSEKSSSFLNNKEPCGQHHGQHFPEKCEVLRGSEESVQLYLRRFLSRAIKRPCGVFDLADFRIAAAPFAQKNLSILLDMHTLREQARAGI